MDCYIFGYLSLLSEESMLATIGADESVHDNIPCKLNGYKRTWSSHRDTKDEVFKRYVDIDNLNPVNRFSWSTLRADTKYTTNGICYKVDKEELLNIDAREVGYERVDITDKVSPYNDFSLDDLVVYTYIAPEVNCRPSETHIDMTYVNMGILGAERINKTTPGFLEDYVNSTEVCTSTVQELYQIFWSYDGKKLYLLDTHDSTVIQLHSFTNYIYTIRKGNDPYEGQTITFDKQDLDYRNAVSGKSGKYSDAISSSDKDILSTLFSAKDFWLDLFLLRNANIIPEEKLKIVKRGNWLTQIIAIDVFKSKELFELDGDCWVDDLRKK